MAKILTIAHNRNVGGAEGGAGVAARNGDHVAAADAARFAVDRDHAHDLTAVGADHEVVAVQILGHNALQSARTVGVAGAIIAGTVVARAVIE